MATALLATVGVRSRAHSFPKLFAILIGVKAIAFIVGYFLQDIKLALYIGLGGTALTFFLVVPPWPFFNRHPVRWLPIGGKEAHSQGIVVDGKVVG